MMWSVDNSNTWSTIRSNKQQVDDSIPGSVLLCSIAPEELSGRGEERIAPATHTLTAAACDCKNSLHYLRTYYVCTHEIRTFLSRKRLNLEELRRIGERFLTWRKSFGLVRRAGGERTIIATPEGKYCERCRYVRQTVNLIVFWNLNVTFLIICE